MVKYVLRRLLYVVVVFVIVSVILFGIFQMVPGDRARMMVNTDVARSNPEQYQRMYEQARKDLGLDEPIVVQYFKWFGGMLTGNFGFSFHFKQNVVDIVAEPMKNTLQLNVISLVLVFAITIPLGIATAVRKNTVFDQGVQVFTVIGISLPSFIVALIFIVLFGILIPIFPISGVYSAGLTATDASSFRLLMDKLWHMCLPLIVMTVTSMASITRYVRTAMIDALSQDYIRTARAKGLKEKTVIYSHAFRNALIPVVTILTGWFISIFSGSIVIESVFAWNGIGNLLYQSLLRQDYTVVLTMNMFYTLLTLVGNLLMDLAYGLVDPRVKLS